MSNLSIILFFPNIANKTCGQYTIGMDKQMASDINSHLPFGFSLLVSFGDSRIIIRLLAGLNSVASYIARSFILWLNGRSCYSSSLFALT